MSKHSPISRVATIMFLYAALMVSFGVLAYLIAPAGANATTAIIATGACAAIMVAMGVMSLMINKKRKVGMIGIHLGLILPLVFAGVFLMRAGSNYRSSGVYGYFEDAYQADLESRDVTDSESLRESFLSGAKPENGKKIPEHDKAYLGFILTLLFGFSVAAFMFLLLSRPELPPKPVAAQAGTKPA
ncbi:MAG: hypothetical protein Phyf2KO_21230 [Phycisphaerales bacterium]